MLETPLETEKLTIIEEENKEKKEEEKEPEVKDLSKPKEKVEVFGNKVDDKQTKEKKKEENIDIPKDET